MEKRKCVQCGNCCLATNCMLFGLFAPIDYSDFEGTQVHICKYIRHDEGKAVCLRYDKVTGGGDCSSGGFDEYDKTLFSRLIKAGRIKKYRRIKKLWK